MFCIKCGKQLADDSLFCAYCGVPIRRDPAEESAQPQQPETPLQDLEQRKKEIYTLRWCGLARSPLVLIVVICLTVAWILEFFNLLALSPSYAKIYGFTQVPPILILIGIIPSPFMVGFWMLYRAGKGGRTEPIKCGGLKLMRIWLIIHAVLLCICVLLLLFCLVAISIIPRTDIHTEITFIFVFFLLIMLVIVCLQFLFLHGLKLIIKSAQTCIPNTKMVMYLAVICFISGGYSLLSQLSAGLTFSNLISAAAVIMIGILLVQYRSCMYSIEYAFMKLEEEPQP